MSTTTSSLPDHISKALRLHDEATVQSTFKTFCMSLNATLENEKTILFFACEFGTIQSVKIILQLGADRNLQDRAGRTALHGAIIRGRSDIIQLLLETGPEIANIYDKKGTTPLHLAAENGYTETVRLLLDKRVDMNLQDMCKHTPLYLAIDKDHKLICELLLQAGAHCPSPAVTQDPVMKALLQFYSAEATWLRAHLAECKMHYKQIRRCETALVCEEGFSTEEVFASTAPATQFNAAYLSRIGISGLGVQQLLLRLHLRLHQKHRRLTEEAAVAELAVTTAGAGAGDSSGAGATTGTVDA